MVNNKFIYRLWMAKNKHCEKKAKQIKYTGVLNYTRQTLSQTLNT